MSFTTGLSSYKGKGVDVTSVIKDLIAKTNPAKTLNPFGTTGNKAIESGQTTTMFVNAGNDRAAQPSNLIPLIENINKNFKSIADAFQPTKATQDPTKGPESGAPIGTSLSDTFLSTFNQYSNLIILGGLALIGISLLRRK